MIYRSGIMKKIPGTLFQLEIESSKDAKFTLKVWYRDQLVYENQYSELE